MKTLEEKRAYQKAYHKTYVRKHRDRRAYHKAYRAKHKEKPRNRREYQRAYKRKRYALKLGVYHKKYADMDIFERDGWICGICGQKINRRLKYPNPRSKSIDHIVPISQGGADAPINLQAAHLRCNISKNAGLGGQLRLIG